MKRQLEAHLDVVKYRIFVPQAIDVPFTKRVAMKSFKQAILLILLLGVPGFSSLAQTGISALNQVLNPNQTPKKEQIQQIATQHSLDSILRMHQTIQVKLDSGSILSKDSLLLYRTELTQGQEKVNLLKESVETAASDTTGMLGQAITLYFKLGTLKSKVDERIRKQDNQIIKKNAGYIWNAPVKLSLHSLLAPIGELFQKPQVQDQLGGNSQGSNIFLLLLVTAGFFYWITKNKPTELPKNSSPFSFLPLPSSLLFLFLILPYMDHQLTARYMELIHLGVLMVMYWLIPASSKLQDRMKWLVFIGLYSGAILMNYMIMSNGFLVRAGLIAFNAAAVLLAYIAVKQVKRNGNFHRTYRVLFVAFCFLMSMAVVLNFIGQINVAKIASLSACIGVVQLIGLVQLGRIIMAGIHVQFERFQSSETLLSKINHAITFSFVQNVLYVLGFILWVKVLLINLAIFEPVSTGYNAILESPHAWGSFNFTFKNLIHFGIIVFIAHWLQKSISSIFAEQTNYSNRYDAQKNQNGSKITLVRLAVIGFGFFFAITALGISMTKLTVIIGALSVGIGLGMQTIFNNFVSGIILIFEKPFHIGDLIELGGQKGRVRSIGIRSSTLLTEQGSEIIIPNGDLLSGRVINYTLSDDYIKSELVLKVASSVDYEPLKARIMEALKKSDHVVSQLPIEILYSSISTNDRTFKIQCWLKNNYIESQFKSDLLASLSQEFTAEEMLALS